MRPLHKSVLLTLSGRVILMKTFVQLSVYDLFISPTDKNSSKTNASEYLGIIEKMFSLYYMHSAALKFNPPTILSSVTKFNFLWRVFVCENNFISNDCSYTFSVNTYPIAKYNFYLFQIFNINTHP